MQELTDTDVGDIIALLKQCYGYDFADYSMASFKRRLQRIMDNSRIKTAGSLHELILHDKLFGEKLLENLTVNVTEMFRDPHFYRQLVEKVVPVLASYPIIQVWHAGCSTGEEVFSLAILLQEAGLLNRCRIYATDLNPHNIEKARQGIIDAKLMKGYTQNYMAAGGKDDFSAYYTARYEHAIIRKELRDKIVFLQHNLASDGVFNEFQLICCRNVLIYFNRVFYNSLAPLGYLALGTKESLLFSHVKERFEAVDAAAKIFRKKD
jgi:chemotaxis protein methyltransferase CheR